MRDPVRLREVNSRADVETRALLAGADVEEPSKAERDRIWEGLALQIQILPAPLPVAPLASVAATGTAALVGKIVVGVVLATAVGAGVRLAGSRTHTAVPVRAPVLAEIPAPAMPSIEPVAPLVPARVVQKPVAHRTRPAPAAAALPAPAKTPEVRVTSAPMVVSNELLEEGRRLSRARAALRAHDSEGALRLLQSGPAGSAGLAQEREALTIEALWSRPSSRSEAITRARAFMAAYPDSPYRARIKALVLQER